MLVFQNHRNELNQLAEALLEHETLDAKDVDTVIRGGKVIKENSLGDQTQTQKEKDLDLENNNDLNNIQFTDDSIKGEHMKENTISG